jgi:hypothetical protein
MSNYKFMGKNWILLGRFVITAAGTSSMLTETLSIVCARYISLRKIDGIIILLYEFFSKNDKMSYLHECLRNANKHWYLFM